MVGLNSIITLREVFDAVFMSLILGFVFGDFLGRFAPRRRGRGYYSRFNLGLPYSYSHYGFDLEGFKFAVMLVAPAIILHELAHKFVALSFGMQATFYAAYFWLFLALLLKAIKAPFIFFVPAFVSITGSGTYLQYSMIAVAGPLMNLLLYLISNFMARKLLVSGRKQELPFWLLSAKINLFLFIFNMLPIPGFDGFKFYYGLLRAIF